MSITPQFVTKRRAYVESMLVVVHIQEGDTSNNHDITYRMKGWAETFGKRPSNVEFLADPKGEFTQALDKELLWDGLKEVTGGLRSKRFAAVIENGKVTKAVVEPDGTGVNCKSTMDVNRCVCVFAGDGWM